MEVAINRNISSSNFVNYSTSSLQTPVFYNGLTPGGVLRGAKINGRMSPIRRFFCLFVMFDLLLTSLLWFLVLVLAAICRFVGLLLFYGLLQISHWFVVALSTATSCTFLVAKVYYFNWENSNIEILQVVLILTCFVIVWAEVWLLDIRVVPHERVAREFLEGGLFRGAIDERMPILHPRLQQINNLADNTSGSGRSFYSPYGDTSDSSDDDGSQPRRFRRRKKENTYVMNELYKTEAKAAVLSAWDLLNRSDYKIEKITTDGDEIHSCKDDSGRKVFRLTGTIDASLSDLKRILYEKLSDMPTWNPTMKSSKVIQIIDSCTDISCQITKEAGKGIISSREYITIRRVEEIHEHLIIASCSIPYERETPGQSLIRGEIGPSCWALRTVTSGLTEIKWLVNTKVSGWLPQVTVDMAITSAMTDNIFHLKKHCASLYTSGIDTNSN